MKNNCTRPCYWRRITGIIRLSLTLCITLVLVTPALAQTGFGTTTPDPQSVLTIASTTKGVLLPRLTPTELSALAGTLTTSQTGMMVTDSTTGRTIYWNGSSWQAFSGVTATATTPLSVSSTNTLALNPGTAAGDLITWDGVNWINMQPATQHFSITQDNRQPYLTLNYCIALQGVFPSQTSSEPFLGEIELYSFNFPPKGFAFCNGQLLSLSANVALFALMGTTYGGNGSTNFGLPNLQGRVSMHQGQGPGLSAFTIGQTGGVESNTISQ